MAWAWACEPKGHWFDSHPGHMPGLWATSPVGGMREATTHWCFSSSLFPSFPLSLKINKIFKREIKSLLHHFQKLLLTMFLKIKFHQHFLSPTRDCASWQESWKYVIGASPFTNSWLHLKGGMSSLLQGTLMYVL